VPPHRAWHAGCSSRRRQRAGAAPRPILAAAGALEELREGGITDYSSPKFKGDEKAQRIEEAFQDLFWGATQAPRVLESFRRLQVLGDCISS
jgi:hypothetical protein